MSFSYIRTRRSQFHDSPFLHDGPHGSSTGEPSGGGGGVGPGGGGTSTLGEPIGLLLALTKAA